MAEETEWTITSNEARTKIELSLQGEKCDYSPDLGDGIFRHMEADGYVERRYTKDNPRPTSHTTQQFRPTDLGKRVAAEVFKGATS